MKMILVICVLLLNNVRLYADSELKLELTALANSFVECEAIAIRLTWQNISKTDIRIGVDTTPDRSSYVTLFVDGRSTLRLPSPHGELIYSSPRAKQSLRPGEQQSGSVSVFDLDLLPGNTYAIKAVADFTSSPEGYFHGIVESNSLSISIQHPNDKDLAAFRDAEHLAGSPKLDQKQRRIAVCAALQSDKILVSHPESIYAAWQLFMFHIDRVDNRDPLTIARLIYQQEFPGSRSIPDPSNFQKRVSLTGRELAQWEYDAASGILKNHPDFPEADSLKLSMAANGLALGRADNVMPILREVGDKLTSPSATWAQKFQQALIVVKENKE